MKPEDLAKCLKTTEGKQVVTRLLESLHYDPTIISGGIFESTKHDDYTNILRAFVKQVKSAIPDNSHEKGSLNCLKLLKNTPEIDLGDLKGISKNMETILERKKAIEKLKEVCQRL